MADVASNPDAETRGGTPSLSARVLCSREQQRHRRLAIQSDIATLPTLAARSHATVIVGSLLGLPAIDTIAR